MATRSAIGIIGNESVRGIYCHWDGYIEHNGQILNRFYPTANLVNALIDQGDLSSLGSEIGTKHEFGVKPEYIETDLTTSVAKECNFYGRDRGETGVEPKEFESKEEFLDYFDGCGCEYFYLFDPMQGTWSVLGHNGFFNPLTAVIAELEQKRKVESNV